MIFITGDLHMDIDIESLYRLKEKYPNLTKKDYVIVAGDFGGCWNKKNWILTKTWMEKMPFTLLFVDGNHENFTLLNSFPEKIWNGGEIHELSSDIIHLKRGQVFTIDGYKFFTLGGAESIDRVYRKENVSWWKEESITLEDIDISMQNLQKIDFKVDYVITHTMPASILFYPPFYSFTFGIPKRSENMLEPLKQKLSFQKWFFGHWHEDKIINDEFIAVYNDIYLIKDKEIEKVIEAL